jgi:hypothetical protein
VVNDVKLPWVMFVTNHTQWGATKFGKGGEGKRASHMSIIQKGLDRDVNEIFMLQSRLKIPARLPRLVTREANVGTKLNYKLLPCKRKPKRIL